MENKQAPITINPVNYMIGHYTSYLDKESTDISDKFKDLFALAEHKVRVPSADTDKAVIKSIADHALSILASGKIAFTSYEILMSDEYDVSRIIDPLKKCGIMLYKESEYYIFVIISETALLEAHKADRTKLNARLDNLANIAARLINDAYFFFTTGRYVEFDLVTTLKAVNPYTGTERTSEIPLLTAEEVGILLQTLNTKFNAQVVLGRKLVIKSIA